MMKFLVAFVIVVFVDAVASQCSCPTMKWGSCDDSCTCSVPVGSTDSPTKQLLNCSALIPKCLLMKAEMYRSRAGLSTRSIAGKPTEFALVDNDGIYDPVCDASGRFKAVQCNNTEVCWCVNSAGVRRSDKGDVNIKCDPVETYWVRLELKHNKTAVPLNAADVTTGLQNTFQQRYQLNKKFISNVNYEQNERLVVIDLKKDKGERVTDLPTAGYYFEKDVKALPLFLSQAPLVVNVNGNNVTFEKILLYYVDEVMPTITMQHVTGGIIAVIVVVSLIVVAGILALIFLRRREKAQYSKAQPREMETMS